MWEQQLDFWEMKTIHCDLQCRWDWRIFIYPQILHTSLPKVQRRGLWRINDVEWYYGGSEFECAIKNIIGINEPRIIVRKEYQQLLVRQKCSSKSEIIGSSMAITNSVDNDRLKYYLTLAKNFFLFAFFVVISRAIKQCNSLCQSYSSTSYISWADASWTAFKCQRRCLIYCNWQLA